MSAVSSGDVRRALEVWAGRGEPAAVATLIDVRRSAPRAPGARFALSTSGEIAGSVSSGCVEGDLHLRLEGQLSGDEAVLVEYGITDEMAAGVGLSCGGEITVLIERHRAEDPVWAVTSEAVGNAEPIVLITGVAEGIRSRRLAVRATDVTGSLGTKGLDSRAREVAKDLMYRSGGRRVELTSGDAETSVFAETFAPPPRLAIVGATPIGAALCDFASRCGFDVFVIDPRSAFARTDRFPAAKRVYVEWPDTALADLTIDRHSNVVVLTHDAKLDHPALMAALSMECGYVGLLGGGRTQRLRRDELETAGLAPDLIARLKGPVGLRIGAASPEQIAVSILAELIDEGRAP